MHLRATLALTPAEREKFRALAKHSLPLTSSSAASWGERVRVGELMHTAKGRMTARNEHFNHRYPTESGWRAVHGLKATDTIIRSPRDSRADFAS